MIRLSIRFAGAVALVALSMPALQAAAQQEAPVAPAPALVAPAPVAPVFPKPNPANFTATTPTTETVNAFLQASWGYDTNRIWQVQAILKTPAEGVSKVVIFVGDKSGKEKPAVAEFYVLPDGKHILAVNNIIPFGEHPFAEYRAIAQARAEGPYRGSAMKDLEIIEFADLECAHCKEVQANLDKLAVEFPKARIIFETFPLENVHAQSERAAAYGVCVAKQGGSGAFFSFANAVFDGQAGFATADGATLTLNSAVIKAGLEPAKIEACSTTPPAVAEVASMVKLARDLNINQVPMLLINGRPVTANTSYDTLKTIVEYQAKMDGVTQ